MNSHAMRCRYKVATLTPDAQDWYEHVTYQLAGILACDHKISSKYVLELLSRGLKRLRVQPSCVS